MFEYQINGTRFSSDDTVKIEFRAIDEYGQINLSGYVPASTEEFFQHSSSMKGMQELVKEKVKDRLENGKEMKDEDAE